MHYAIEIRQELVAHSRAKLAEYGCTHVDVRHGSCLALDPSSSMRFQRIYLGAGADENIGALLFNLLEIGGILVGPFASADGSQRLLRISRIDETDFQVRELMHVQFTPLIPSLPTEVSLNARSAHDTPPHATTQSVAAGADASPSQSAANASGGGDTTPAPKRPRACTIRLEAPCWSPEIWVRAPPHATPTTNA